ERASGVAIRKSFSSPLSRMSSSRFQAPEWTKNCSLSPSPWKKYNTGKVRPLSASNDGGRTMQYGTGRARILLGMELHSTRPAARVGRGINSIHISRNNSTYRSVALFITERVNRIELGSTRSRIEPGNETHKHGKA